MRINSIAFLAFLLVSFGIKGQDFLIKDLKEEISFLASDKLKGRGTSSAEEVMAAKFIAGKFKKAGLTAFNNSYLKPFVYKKSTNPHDTSTANGKES